MWRTFLLPPEHAFIGWARCLWCGERGHFRETCARVHEHGAVTRDGACLGCDSPVALAG